MKYLRLFKAIFKKRYIQLKRYMFNTLMRLATNYIIFLLFFLGIKTFVNPAPQSRMIDGYIVGFLIWTYAIFAYSQMSRHLMSEARAGTLEQLYISPFSFGWVSSFQVISSFIIDFFVVMILFASMLITTGRSLHIDFVTLIPLLFITLLSAYGIGFLMGGLALIFKRIGNTFQILQFVFIALIATPVEKFPQIIYLPLSFGTQTIFKTMTRNIKLWEIPLGDLLFLTGNSLFYLALGVAVFKICEKTAKKHGLLGHY